MATRGQKGFTLVEVIVVAGIIAILAGILVPLILKEIDEARITRAYADARSISTAIIIMKKDTGKWPDLAGIAGMPGNCTPTATFLFGEGDPPGNLAANGYDQTTSTIDDYLTADANGCYGAKWKGPYLAHVSPDPWGNAYMINVGAITAGGTAWILSAGPDGVIDTPAGMPTLQGDDVGMIITKTVAIL